MPSQSPESHVGAVLSAFEALNRGDLDAALAQTHPEAEFDWMDSNAPYAEVMSGRAGARTRLEEFFAMWDELRWTPEELVEVDGGHVIAVTHVRARGRDGIELDARGAWLWSFRDGVAVRVKLCQTKESALDTLRAESA
jgi:ketosteroid isomerase-like protein